MKILVFSDSHLTHKFDQELFDYISNLIKDVDQVIINGDFWDGYLTTYKKFIKSRWNQLFPLLKSKKTIYIFGNHDKKKFMHNNHDLFSVKQSDYYEFKSGNKDFFVSHGHLISPTYDNAIFLRNPMFVRFLYRFFVFLTQKLLIFENIFKKVEHKKNIQKLATFKDYTVKAKKAGQYFIFGHVHVPVFDLLDNFICLGSLQSTSKNYCIIENGKIVHKRD